MDESPTWPVGRWWQWRVESPHHPQFEVRTVVVEATATSYEVAATPEDKALWLSWFHAPPHGHLARPGLVWEAHGKPVRLLDFPLHDGKRWVGELEGEVLLLTARSEGRDYHVTGDYEDGRRALTMVYSTTYSSIQDLTLFYGGSEPWARAVVIEQGEAHSGAATRIRASDVYLDGAGSTSQPRQTRFQVPADQDRILFGCLLQGNAGSYEIRFTSPRGEEVVCSHSASGLQREGRVQLVIRQPVAGEWAVRMTVGGQGSVLAEVTVFTLP